MSRFYVSIWMFSPQRNTQSIFSDCAFKTRRKDFCYVVMSQLYNRRPQGFSSVQAWLHKDLQSWCRNTVGSGLWQLTNQNRLSFFLRGALKRQALKRALQQWIVYEELCVFEYYKACNHFREHARNESITYGTFDWCDYEVLPVVDTLKHL